MTFSGPSFNDLYIKLMTHLFDTGKIQAKFLTIDHINIELTNPYDSLIYYPKNWSWGLVEGIDRLSGFLPQNQHINPGRAYRHRLTWKKKLEKEGGKFHYSYGEVFDLYRDRLLKDLKRLGNKRELIVSVWERSHYLSSEKYLRRPCTLDLHFYPFDGKLNLTAYMRVVDMANLLPYDIFHHSLLLILMAETLGHPVGSLRLVASFGYIHKKRLYREAYKTNLLSQLSSKPSDIPLVESGFTLTDLESINQLLNLMEVCSVQIILQEPLYLSLKGFGLAYMNALLYLYYKIPKELHQFQVVTV